MRSAPQVSAREEHRVVSRLVSAARVNSSRGNYRYSFRDCVPRFVYPARFIRVINAPGITESYRELERDFRTLDVFDRESTRRKARLANREYHGAGHG